MERAPSDESLSETLKTLIISRKGPVSVSQLQQEIEKFDGNKIPELKLKSLLRYNSTFHCIKPTNGQEELFDVRYDVRARMKLNKKRNVPAAIVKNLTPPRNRYTVTVNNNNNNNGNHRNLNIHANGDGPPAAPVVDLRQRIIRNNNQQYQHVQPLKLTMPLSERLKKKGELSPQDIIAANVVKVPESWDTSAGSYFDKLIKYCQLQKIPPPELKLRKNPLVANSYRCEVTIKDKIYASYNESFPSETEAQEACCKVAVKELQEEEKLSKNPLDFSNEFEIVKKVWQMIRSSVGGVFIKSVPERYIATYSLSLPENWHQLAKQSEGKLFTFEVNSFNEPIMFAIGELNSLADRPPTTPTTPEVPTQLIPELQFPWKEKLWNVFITSAFSTNDICGRLIGDTYSGALDRLLNEMEIIMMTDKKEPAEVKRNQIYLTSIAECWHRIRVVEIGEKQANCICIDNGDYEWIPLNEIYVCKPEFLTIAPQAFKLSLFGLEDFENDPNMAQQPFFEPLSLKSLVGEVMIDQKEWQQNKTQAIKMILYDTSTDDDVNLNESLISTILRSIPAPVLSIKDSNQVIVTSIGDEAIHCQLVKSASYIQQLINAVAKTDLAKHRGFYVDKSDKKQIYLVYDAKLKNWYRARLERLMDGDMALMSYVDLGAKATVAAKDIYRLDKLSFVLFFYPPQVIKFGLFNVQLTDEVKKKLMALLPSGRQALVSLLLSH